MTRQMVVTVCVALVAGGAFAQTASPTVAPFPLDIPRPTNFSAKQREELNQTFKVLLRRGGAISPDGARMKVALAEIRREDCDREDQCLAQLATHAGALYAIYASVKLTNEGEVVAYGRVVRDDGKLVASLKPGEMVKMPKGRQNFMDVAELALQALLERLNVRSLPLAKPVESPPVVVTEPAPEVKPEHPLLTPPPMPTVTAEDGASRRNAGKVMLVAGTGVLVVGAVLGAVGLGVAGGLTPVNGAIPESQLGATTTSRALKTTGLVMLGAGAACAAAGGALWGLTPAAAMPVQTFIEPQAGGAVVGFSGGF